MRKETAPKEVVDFINEKIEQDCTLGQVAEYFYHTMEFESTWSNFPYIVKWGRLNFTLFAELWIDRLNGGSGMKKIYEISVYGCDDTTRIRQELTFEEYEFLNKIAEKITNASEYGCMPTMEIEEETK